MFYYKFTIVRERSNLSLPVVLNEATASLIESAHKNPISFNLVTLYRIFQQNLLGKISCCSRREFQQYKIYFVNIWIGILFCRLMFQIGLLERVKFYFSVVFLSELNLCNV